ncbi:MAG: porin family protein [Syntrophaceae bacterium]|nr:porin family protein [Syntrophaceae bacterium]
MKKLFAVIISFFMLSGVAFSAEPAAVPEKQKSAKVKKVHLKKSEYTSGPHITVQGGVAFLTDSDVTEGNTMRIVDTDPGYAFSVAAGYRLNALAKMLRVEGELGYQKNEVDNASGRRDVTGDIKAYTFLVNGYYDFVGGKKIVPFITAGIGAAKVDADVNYFTHVDDVAGVYQVGAGFYYTITDNWHIELKYRYLDTFTDLEGGNTNPEFSSHNVLLGVRYRFPL